MIVYNITLKINPSILEKWIQWQKGEHIPEIMATGLFTDYKFYKLLEQDESEGPTYVVQFFADSYEKYNKYIAEFATGLRTKSLEKWGNGFVAFRSILQVVN